MVISQGCSEIYLIPKDQHEKKKWEISFANHSKTQQNHGGSCFTVRAENQNKMFITHLPKLHSHFSIFCPKPKILITSTLLSKSKTTPFSHFSSVTAAANTLLQSPDSQTKNLELEDAQEQNTHIEISVEKLFVPPDTDISSGSRPLSARILKGSNIVLSKYAGDAQVEQAEFVKSSVETEECPSDGKPEFALVGRSNVGKSSLLNSLVKRKRLALTSKKPGFHTFFA